MKGYRRRLLHGPASAPWETVLAWAAFSEPFCFLDSASADVYGKFSLLVGGGAARRLQPAARSGVATKAEWNQAKAVYRAAPSWWFGLMSYEFKNVLESLGTSASRFPDTPDFCFFEPQWVLGVPSDGSDSWVEFHASMTSAEEAAWWALWQREIGVDALGGDNEPESVGRARWQRENAENAEKKEDSENAENSENSEDSENAENSENSEDSENAKNSENSENAKNSENSENSEKTENSENSENSENALGGQNEHGSARKFTLLSPTAEQQQDYIRAAQELLDHMRKGNLYEANLCLAWDYPVAPDPLSLYAAWREKSKAPMAGLFRWKDVWLVSGSPERYLQIESNRVISRPIKGTAPRGKSPEEDRASENQLRESSKERAENIMIVDVVRNDLSRFCVPGTVHVPSLCAIESFETVHQMVSTVEGALLPGADGFTALECSFPMGSMTGAPKVEAMKRLDEVEKFARGWYSGSLGYLSPDGSSDWNVVIRSLLVHTKEKRTRTAAGSALTLAADPLQEWSECLLKVAAVHSVLEKVVLNDV